MFQKTWIGDYIWEVTPKIILRFVDESFIDITDQVRTVLEIDNVSYGLLGDLRKEFEATEGDVKKIKQVYADNIDKVEFEIPHRADKSLHLVTFIRHIDKHIKS